MLLEKSNKITAILCHSPPAIIGCLSGIQQVSLIGFEDMMHINLTSPLFCYISASGELVLQEFA